MPAESELFKDKIEVSLDGRQIFYLFFGGAVIVALVFVLGVMVGKRVEARAHVDCGAATQAHDPLAALDALGQEDDLAFPAALAADDVGDREDAERALIGAIDEQVLAAADKAGESDESAGAKKAEKARAEKAAADRARADKAAADKAKKAAAEKARAGKAAAEKARSEKARAERAAAEKARAEKAAREKARAEKASRDEAADKPAAAPGVKQSESDKDKSSESARFTLQLSSFRDRAEADSFYDRLKTSGYDPYVIEAEVPGKGTWYRVRLGEYNSWASAVEAKKDFEASQHVIAYVTRIK